ncbi:MAG: prolyl oligopeptidase family serine peptidase [Vicinamibacterales bacterium]
MHRMPTVLLRLGVLAVLLTAVVSAQSKPTLTPADYDQFESVSAGASRGGLSPDGKWLLYAINRVGGKNELRLARVGERAPVKVVEYASGASFTSGSDWIAYGIGYSEEETERMRTARTPIRRKLGLYELATGTETIIEGIESFAFDRAGQAVAMKRYAPAPAGNAAAAGGAGGGAGAAGGSAAAAAPVGTTLLVRDLKTGTETTFGNVTEYAWQPTDNGRLLAMIISADGQAGNGVHLFDAATSRLTVLHAASADYSGLTWRDDSSDLAVLRSKTLDTKDGPTEVAMAWLSVGQPNQQVRTLDPMANGAETLRGQRLSSSRRPSWLDGPADGSPMIMLGVAEWPDKPAAPEGGRGRAGGRGGAAANEKPDVDIWHWNDHIVMPAQKLRVNTDRRRNLPAVWHLAGNTITVVGESFDESVAPIRGTRSALVSVFTPYLMARSIGRGASDLYIADLSTGARRPLKTNVTGNASVSPTGKYVLHSTGGHWWTIDLSTGRETNITRTVKTSFIDTESDSTAPEKPMFGSAGWTADDAAVVLYDKFDMWSVTPDGRTATRLTNGSADQLRHRYTRVDAAGFGAPPAPVELSGGYVSLFGTMNKQSGYGRLSTTNGSTTVERLVLADKSISSLAKAEKADVYIHSAQAADDSPDLFTSGADLENAVQATETNPFLSKYAWTKSELVTYTVQWKGQPKTTLQGILHYPANYEPGRTYPMVVYLYEKLSDGLHRFQNPSERDYYNGTSLTQNGYFYYQPDIIFQPGEPGVSVVESVTAAVKAVTDRGMVDATKVGVMGHSWGGFDSMYLSTHSKIFAAAVSGAGISNLISNYGSHHFSSGIAETDHIETGQQRMVVPLYEDLQRYIRNSAVFGISTMTTPMLLMTGDNDGTVYWHQSVEFYNIARRAKKNVVMLVYNGEDHGLRVKKNQVDYHRRIRQWFDHYLKGAPAEKWITDGVSALERQGR